MRSNDKGFHRSIRVSWFDKFERSANKRGIDWDLTLDDLADLYDKQEGKCSLTGWHIYMPNSGYHLDTEASIDRINSAFGYITGNVQLVNKRVNMMKQSYSQSQFIDTCRGVATYRRQSNGT